MSSVCLPKCAERLRRAVSSCRIEALEDRRLFAVGAPSMVLDINPGTSGSVSLQSTPGASARLGDVLLFAANDGVHGTELWRTDGTAAGTYMVTEINPVLGPNGPSTPTNFATLNGVAYFTANGPADGRELWRSDGTAEGTYLVKDLYPGTTTSSPSSLIATEDALYFIASDGVTGYEVYQSDGTADGTVRLTDVTPDGGTTRLISPLVASGDNVYFVANDTGSGSRLWKYDGVSASAVYELSSGISTPTQLLDFNGTLMFAAVAPGGIGQQLFRSDGTAAGTYNLTDSLQLSPGNSLSGLTELGDTLYFSGLTGDGSELWKSDGTVAGTTQVTNFLVQGPTSLKAFGGKLYFAASIDAASGTELFVSDGTAAGTQMFLDINAGTGSSSPVPQTMTPDGLIYFLASDATTGQELWVTDGTVGGTFRTANIGLSTKSAFISLVGTLGNAVLFAASDGSHGSELWHVESPVPPPPNTPPTAVISGAPASVNEGETLTLSSADSTDSDGTILSRSWDFDYDGVTFTADAGGSTASLTIADGNGPLTIALRVTDNDGGVHIATVTIDTVNLPPTVGTISYSSSVLEGSASTMLTLNGLSDPGSTDTAAGFGLSYDFDGDGTFDLVDVAASSVAVPNSLYADGNRTFSMAARITDKDGGYSDYVLPVTVANVAPKADLGIDNAASEASPVTLVFRNARDDSPVDLAAGFTYSFDFDNDGVFEIAGSTSASAQYTWADSGAKLWRGRITDKDGGFRDYVMQVNVANVAPTASFVQLGSAVEGSNATVAFSAQADVSAPDAAAGYTYGYDFDNNGIFEVDGETDASATHTFADDGVYTVRGLIRDKDGGVRVYTTTVTVANANPTVQLGAPATAVEGNVVQLTSQVSDAGTADTHSYAWTIRKNGNVFATGSGTGLAFTPDDQGTYDVSLTVTDKDGGTGSASGVIAVSNRAPTAVFAAAGVINEGSAGTISFTNISDAAADLAGLRFSFDFNNDGDFADAGEIANGTSASRSFTWTDNGVKTIRGRITDKDGAFTDYTTTVTVNSVAPVATITGPTTGKRNKGLSFVLQAADASTIDAASNFTFHIDWDGNGTIDQIVSGPSGMKVSHKFAAKGTYNVRITATDKDGAVSLLSAPLAVTIS